MHERRLLLSGLICLTLTAVMAIGPGCSSDGDDNQAAGGDTAAPSDTSQAVASPEQFIIAPPPESAPSLLLKRQELFSWFPSRSDRVEYALEGVTNIVMFSDLGLGDQLDVTLPPRPTGWPVGQSVRLKLNADRTALAMRFALDTLPGGSVRGEGLLGVFAVHAGDTLGREVEIPRTQSNVGRLDVLYRFNQLVAQVNCCDLPPTFLLNGYGAVGDTLGLIVTFDRTNGQYLTTLLGPNNARAYPGRSYVRFRTERGEYHKDVEDYPYFYETTDPGWVNLLFGSRWRGKKMSTEPVLTARIF